MRRPLKYYGGKLRLSKQICALIKVAKWNTYTECFVGGGAVFFALQEMFPNRRFVLNDKNANIANFYEVAHTPALHRKLMELTRRRGIIAQSHYNRAGEIIRGAKADEIERAWAVFYNLTYGFGGMLDTNTARTIGITHDGPGGNFPVTLQNKIALLESTTAALRNAFIMNHDAVDAARRFDAPEVMHYFDPPYIGADMGHYDGYTENDFSELLEFCANCEGRFILSHFDNNAALTAAIERHGWNAQRIERFMSTGNNNRKEKAQTKRVELLVYNFSETSGGLL